MIPKEGVGILKPKEFKAILDVLNRNEDRVKILFLLLSGMRYVEAQRFQAHPEWIDKESGFILLPKIAQLKEKRSQLERTVRLTTLGKEIARQFCRPENELPSRTGWNDNMKRWASLAKIEERSDCSICAKTTRKTYESWLLSYYQKETDIHYKVCLSQGHDSITSIRHYVGMAFTPEDILSMKEWVEGWI